MGLKTFPMTDRHAINLTNTFFLEHHIFTGEES